MAKKDYYQVLGVEKGADDAQIKKAYRQKVKQYHPDHNQDNPEAEEKFKEVSEAYEVLSDSTKRSQYDQFGHDAFDPNRGGGGGTYQYGGGGFGGFDFSDFGGLGDIFGDILGGGRRSSRRDPNAPRRGDDIESSITITFEEAAFGCKKDVSVYHTETCETCHGSGGKPGTGTKTCPKCNGRGVVETMTRTLFGSMPSQQVCPQCGGKGKIPNESCKDCGGRGSSPKKRTISINIPAGVDNGNAITVSQQGNAGQNGGQSGDLILHITVKPHKFFTRRGNDLHVKVNVPFAIAALGGKIMIPTLSGDIEHKISSGSQFGDVIRLRGKGVKIYGTDRFGDLFATIYIEVPKKLNRKQEQLLKDFEESFGRNIAQN